MTYVEALDMARDILKERIDGGAGGLEECYGKLTGLRDSLQKQAIVKKIKGGAAHGAGKSG